MIQRKYIIFATVSLALLMSSVDATIVATALPSIQRSMGAGLNWTGWVITAYQLTTLIMMPLAGRISDELGRKRIFIFCVIIFTASSLFCALAPNIYWLIVFRFLQALGGGSFMPSATGIVSDHFRENRAAAIGLFTTIFPIGGIVGPALGGLLLSIYNWKAIFLVNLPIGGLLIILSYFLLEKDSHVSRTSVDFLGAGLFTSALLSVMFFMTRLGENPAIASLPINYLLPVLALLFLFAFIQREKRAKTPIIDITLLRSKPFAIMNILNMVYGACIFGLATFVPYYGQIIYGMSDLASGTLLTARALGMIGTATLTSMLLRRIGYRIPMGLGFLSVALSTLGLIPYFHPPVILGKAIASYWWLMSLLFVSGVGIGMAGPSSNNAAIELMPEQISAIAGLRGMFRQTGGLIGTSIIVLILSRYQDKVAGFSVIFIGMCILLLIVMPLIREVPNGLQVDPMQIVSLGTEQRDRVAGQ